MLEPDMQPGDRSDTLRSAKALAREGGDKAVPHVGRCVVPVLGGAIVSLQSPIHLMVHEDDGISAAGHLQAENDRSGFAPSLLSVRALARSLCALCVLFVCSLCA